MRIGHVLPALLLVAACSPQRTTIRVSLTTSETMLSLDSLTVAAQNNALAAPPATITNGKPIILQNGKTESFVLLLDGKQVGPVTLTVDGFAAGIRVAHGDAAGTIVKNKTVEITVPMMPAAPLPGPDMAAGGFDLTPALSDAGSTD